MSMAKILRTVGLLASGISLIAGAVAGEYERKEQCERQDRYLDQKVSEHFERYVQSRNENRQ